ncbi:breast cancer anti-estrogen resistance protein 3 homolog isoform X2 [Contarinia nasturtii]|nr:breast cancer anti-estrogen resistance protein 3 homolog isoform X2 [Contarinia nasturtii]XP_031617098.1 breast cancer anti-estrogen resistance protein 3 homolog isoform X2 [Contarinia nasturtii]XP_031617099.1 breast cancer anti-estrogen resistance protein 3 homolog isoform X2 [Contarinia nasturtii]
MAWSFRFSTLSKKQMDPIMVLPRHPHLEISTWLEMLELPQYNESFKKFIGVEELMYFCEADIKQLGVRISAHRARIVSSLVAFRDKYENRSSSSVNTVNRKPTQRKTQRYSMSAIQDKKQKEAVPIYETLNTAQTKQKQSVSLGDLLDMEQSSTKDATNGSSGASTPITPTQESIALKKALEWELSLDKTDLRSHAWYYATIPRQRAEELVEKDGDFLVRDCVSQPGNFVLTCMSKGSILHFVINKVLIQPDTVYERVQYQFEDDCYDTVPDLITYYVGSGKSISVASGARIRFPCNRTYPLSFYATKYGINQSIANSRGVSPLNSPSLVNVGFRYPSYSQLIGINHSYHSPRSSPPHIKRDIPPRLPTKKQRSHSLTPVQPGQTMTACSTKRNLNEKYCSADGIIRAKNGELNGSFNKKFEKNLILDNKYSNAKDVVDSPNENSTDALNRANIGHLSLSRTSLDAPINHSVSTQSLPRSNTNNGVRGIQRTLIHSRTASLTRDGSLDGCTVNRTTFRKQFEEEEEVTTPTDERITSPPLKPNRSMLNLRHDSTTTLKDLPLDGGPQFNRLVSYHASGSDSGNGSGDSAQSSAANDSLAEGAFQQPQRVTGVVIRNPKFLSNSASSTTLKSYAEFDSTEIENNLMALEIPELEQCSKFDLENFTTLLLPAIENKPLDNDALNTIRIMLSETAPRVIANHMSRIDFRLLLDEPAKTEHNEQSIFNCSGIELITLDHGEQFRKDLIERTECIRLLIAVTVLTCSDDAERTETLNKWIQIAIDTKTALGNLYGFSNIMLGLCMPQIERLQSTWYMLRQKYTDSAFNFEAKLRPQWKNMNSCTNPVAPNTTIPHILPYVLLRDRNVTDMLNHMNQIGPPSSLITVCISPWENSSVDFGLSTVFAHIDSLRNFIKNLPMYRRNAQAVLTDNRIDELLEDSFRTEFQMKFLWGSKGSLAPAAERHTKLEQILSLMAEKFCGGSTLTLNGDRSG